MTVIIIERQTDKIIYFFPVPLYPMVFAGYDFVVKVVQKYDVYSTAFS